MTDGPPGAGEPRLARGGTRTAGEQRHEPGRGLMEHRSLSPQTLAAQALGEAYPATGAVAPVIAMSTNYEQRPDGSYPQGQVRGRLGMAAGGRWQLCDAR